ncbi:hypothetical protein NLJ89_g8693 [Agrocybe chaxingu]|uniref:Methyltransferase domain-containing protein n=1 Tax=Agrocybe chaxingu TaxID=84603 RepID=A0A9W8MRX7_9AGAR|nr:hypothetical protein NLJ89_g8693 [Agrocybe chaxingu]
MASTTSFAEQKDQPDSKGWSATQYSQKASFVYSAEFTAPVLDLLGAKPGERILDIGCGSGELTLQLQQIVEQAEGGVVVGTDFSESMLKKAKQIGVKHTFIADAQELEVPKDDSDIPEKFDAVFSNATLQWCKRDPLGVLTRVRGVLKAQGRFVADFSGFMSMIGIRAALHEVVRSRGRDPERCDPWYFPSVDEYQALLTTAGFETKHISLTPRITPLPNGLYDWLSVFARTSFLREFSDEEAAQIMKEVEDRCRGDCQEANGKWAMVSARLRVSAVSKE